MGDLISRSALLKEIKLQKSYAGEMRQQSYRTGFIVSLSMLEGKIAEIPAVDAEPVRHAYWEVKQEDSLQCSACHERWAIRDRGEFIEFEVQEDLKWCPSCGARMDAEVNT